MPAHAQATRTWVSGVGDDANPCSRTAPCKTFAGAISKTAPAGEIDVLDPGGFGALTITKSISIYDDGVGEGGVLVSGTNGFVISAGVSDVVNIRGLTFDGLNTGLSGILILQAGRVNIEKCLIQEFQGGTSQPAGVAVTNNAGTSVNVDIIDTIIVENNLGVLVKPASGAAANVVIQSSHVDKNFGGGVRVDGGNSGNSNVAIADGSMSLNGGNGIVAVSGPGNTNIDLMHDVIADNAQSGVVANNNNGGTAVVTVSSSMLSYNAVGAWNNPTGTATLLSFKNNRVTGPTGSVPGTANFQ